MRVLVVTGSSGGHIFPALAFLESLKEESGAIQTLLVLPEKNINSPDLAASYALRYLPIQPVKLDFSFKNIIAVLKFIKGFFASASILAEFKPDVVVGFGSLNSVPIILWAWLFRVKTLIHEQNVIPGRANKLLAKFADRIAVSFAQTKDYLAVHKGRIAVTGNPLRPQLKKVERKEALDFFKLSEGKFTILVSGGSQGSAHINECFLKSLSGLYDKNKYQLIHISGAGDFDNMSLSYKGLDLDCRLFAFLPQMQYAYSIADLAITRAGAITVAELVKFRVPAIIIPYPYAYNHQFNNAAILKNAGAAIIIKDGELSQGLLREKLKGLMQDPDELKRMRCGYDSIAQPDANTALVKEAKSLN